LERSGHGGCIDFQSNKKSGREKKGRQPGALSNLLSRRFLQNLVDALVGILKVKFAHAVSGSADSASDLAL
jgi:hypothetical protein